MVKKVKKTDHDAKIAETKIKVLNPTDLVKKRFRHIREKIVNKFCVGSKDGVTHSLFDIRKSFKYKKINIFA